jgi:hypothetical protein
MPQFRVHLDAGQVLAGAALLMNDPAQTEYNPDSMLPYLNMAIYELNDHLVESNAPVTNEMSQPLLVKKGENTLTNLPIYLIEIQGVGERAAGSRDSFVPLPKREFLEASPTSSSLLYWSWIGQRVRFNPNGANNDREIQLKYIKVPLQVAQDANTIIGTTDATMYLIYKLAALLAMFVGENQTRAQVLNEQAELALERMEGISNKGKQQMMTRHRPFRAGYKARGY